MKVKTSELIGEALDWAVAKCEGVEYPKYPKHRKLYTPSTDWAKGGPIIEREQIHLRAYDHEKDKWSAEPSMESTGVKLFSFSTGPTALIAAMRCHVARKMGTLVYVPDCLFD